MVHLILFDIDGTLIHTGGAGERAFREVARTVFNLTDGTKDLRFAGRTDPSIVREMFARHDVPDTAENFQKFFDAYVFWLDNFLHQIRGHVLPGVRAWIHESLTLPQPPLLGLLTGNVRLGAQIKLRHYDLWHHFSTGGFGDDNEDRCKIAAVARERASHRLNRELQGDEVLVIGDTPHDIQCGRSIGARTLAVGTGIYKCEELRKHNASWCVPSLEAIDPAAACG
jgi:phosphoglycolate phosphatase